MTPITEDTLAKLEAEHNGKIMLFEAPHAPGEDPEWQIVCRKPNGKEAMNFRLAANNDSRKAYASLDIIKATCVWPERDAFKALLDDQPFMPEGVASSKGWREWVGLEATEQAAKSR